MKRIFNRSTLRKYIDSYPDVKINLEVWHQNVRELVWKSPKDVKKTYGNASILKNNRVVFNIKGNKYRLVAKIDYKKEWVFIRFFGTHQEYDRIDCETI
jgi:mRNA interferase HigB